MEQSYFGYARYKDTYIYELFPNPEFAEESAFDFAVNLFYDEGLNGGRAFDGDTSIEEAIKSEIDYGYFIFSRRACEEHGFDYDMIVE